MFKKWIVPSMTLMLLAFLFVAAVQAGPGAPEVELGTAFTYQGRLNFDGQPLDATCDFQFALYDDELGGVQVGATQAISDVTVSEGMFSVQLDFGGTAFQGDARWLGIRVQCPGDAAYTDLGLQALSATPYALYAMGVPWAGIGDMPAGFADGVDDVSAVVSGTAIYAGVGLNQIAGGEAVTLSVVPSYRLPQACASGQIAEWDGSIWVCGDDDTGSGGGEGWLLTGNAGTDPTAHVLGTTDGVSLTLAVSGTHALRFEPTGSIPNLIGGSEHNAVMLGVEGATIGGGGNSGWPNQVLANYGTVGGGYDNTAGGPVATIGGGYDNTAGGWGTVGGGLTNAATGDLGATVGGGVSNTAGGNQATVGGGSYNLAGAEYATIAGGGPSIPGQPESYNNRVYDDYGVIGGGGGNRAGSDDGTTTNATYATISGGENNIISATHGTIGGGEDNVISATHGTIGGGEDNLLAERYGAIAGGGSNTIIGSYGAVGGGYLNTASGLRATVGGGYYNTADGNDATVGGGYYNTADGDYGAVGGGNRNTVTGDYATVGGGYRNLAEAEYATIAGGGPSDVGEPQTSNNHVYDDYGVIGGGGGNRAGSDDGTTTNATYATISGGENNLVTATYGTIGGGYANTAGNEATVGGGYVNTAAGDRATVAGGYYNTADGDYATVAGGYSNDVAGNDATIGGGYSNTADGNYATVPGGRSNTANGDYSFAVGRRARALHDGSIIFADSNNFDFASLAADTFRVRATGGISFVLGIDGSGDLTWNCHVENGTSWSCSSDRNLKENFDLVAGDEVLRRLAGVPIYTWNAKGQDPALQHMGPTAQDFYAAFELGGDDTHIATIDLDGVALAAIQELYAQNQALEMENADLHRRVDDLEARLSALEDRMADGVIVAPVQANVLPGVGLFLVGGVGLWLSWRKRCEEPLEFFIREGGQ